MKPFIGVTAHIDSGAAVDLYPGHPLLYMERYYTNVLASHGMLPIIIPGLEKHDDIPAYLEYMDGLVLSGGGYLNLDSPLAPSARLSETGSERVEFEQSILRLALQRDMPVLGICRGMQMINEVQGGTLKTLGTSAHHQEIHGVDGATPIHSIKLLPESKLAEMIGAEDIEVNSFHRQVIDSIGGGILASSYSYDDEYIESIESKKHSWVFGMQFHPEQLWQQNERWSGLFDGFREAAISYRIKRK